MIQIMALIDLDKLNEMLDAQIASNPLNFILSGDKALACSLEPLRSYFNCLTHLSIADLLTLISSAASLTVCSPSTTMCCLKLKFSGVCWSFLFCHLVILSPKVYELHDNTSI